MLTIHHRKGNLITKCYTGPRAGSCEHGNEPSGPIKDQEFLDSLSDCLASQEGLCCMECGEVASIRFRVSSSRTTRHILMKSSLHACHT
jgi:hypothetical protein